MPGFDNGIQFICAKRELESLSKL